MALRKEKGFTSGSPNHRTVHPFNALSRRLHSYRLIAKIPHSRRWRISLSGRRIMAAALKLREVAYPSLYAEAA